MDDKKSSYEDPYVAAHDRYDNFPGGNDPYSRNASSYDVEVRMTYIICGIAEQVYQVVAAQTRLAQELRHRPDLREVYLLELLGLFIDKGVAIQNASISNQYFKVIVMTYLLI